MYKEIICHSNSGVHTPTPATYTEWKTAYISLRMHGNKYTGPEHFCNHLVENNI